MKKVSISISYDEDRLSALKLYLGNKKLNIEDELAKALDTLYSKTVPAGVREFIELKNGNAPEPAPPKAYKPKPQESKLPESPGQPKTM